MQPSSLDTVRGGGRVVETNGLTTEECGIFQIMDKNLEAWQFWAAIVIVATIALGRYATHPVQTPLLDRTLGMTSRSYTTLFRYHFGLLGYAIINAGALVAISLLLSFPAIVDFLIEIAVKQLDIGGGEGEAGSGIVNPSVSQLMLGENLYNVCAQLPEDKENGLDIWYFTENAETNLRVLIITSLTIFLTLISSPWIRTLDFRLRNLFHHLSSIPQKAKLIGLQLMDQIPLNGGLDLSTVRRLEDAESNRRIDPAVFMSIATIIDRPMRYLSGHALLQYQDFFHQYEDYIARLKGQFWLINSGEPLTVENERAYRIEMARLNEAIATFLACAILRLERREIRVASFLRDTLRLPHVILPRFRFETGQIVAFAAVSFAVIFLGTWTAATLFQPQDLGVDVAGIVAEGTQGSEAGDDGSAREQRTPLQRAVIYSLPGMLIFLFSMLVAAFMQIWMSDNDFLIGSDRYGEVGDRLGPALFTLVLAYVAALLPLVYVTSSSENFSFQALLPWPLPGAVFAALFVVLFGAFSQQGPVTRTIANFVVFGTVVGIAQVFVTLLDIRIGANERTFEDGVVFTVVSTLTAGTLGAVLGLLTQTPDREAITR